MLEILQEVSLNATQFFALLAISTTVLIIFFGPFSFSLLDPLNVFLITLCADAVLVLGMNWDKSAKIEFACFLTFFWLGLVFAGRTPKSHPTIRFGKDPLFVLALILLVLCVLIVFANLYLGLTAGFPLLSADPSSSKVTVFTGGLGIIKRLNGGPFHFFCCGCTLLILIGYRRYLALSMLVVSCCFVALSGSKGALLPILFVQAFLTHHKGLGQSAKTIKKARRYAIPSLAAASAVAFAVVVRDAGSVFGGLVFFVKRLLFSADLVLFYYPRRGAIPELRGAGLLEYLKYLLDPTLGLLRLKEYAIPLGTIVAGNLETGFGPNVQFFVRADIFFGPVAGCFYCFLIGCIIGFLRRKFFTVQTASPFVFTWVLFAAMSAFVLAVESQMFLEEIVDAALVILPLWGVAILARTAATHHRDLLQVTA